MRRAGFIEIGEELPSELSGRLLRAAYQVEFNDPVVVWLRGLSTHAADRLLDPVVRERGLTRSGVEYLVSATPDEASHLALQSNFCVISSRDIPGTSTNLGSRFMTPARGLVFLESLLHRTSRLPAVRKERRSLWPAGQALATPPLRRSIAF